MEYIVFAGACLAFLLFIFIKGALDTRKNRKRLERRLYEDFGKAPEKEYKPERLARIDRYFKAHPKDGQLDDITWNDLDMDLVFQCMNHTLSSTGEEYLYYTLRTPVLAGDTLETLEKQVTYFCENARQRVDIQMILARLGNMGKYSLYDYLQYLDNLEDRSCRKDIVADLLFLPLIALCFVSPSIGALGIVVLLIYNISSYFRSKKEIEPYIVSFAYILRVLKASEQLTRLQIPVCAAQWEEICRRKKALSGIKGGSSWVMTGGSNSTGGTILDVLMDYIRMSFHVDIIVFHRMRRQLKNHLTDLDVIVTEMGKVETAICIGAYRTYIEKTTPDAKGWCRPDFSGEKLLKLQGAWHPLVKEPVKNSITTGRCVLLTGSNASGKSTFLKTVAINASLAQTIHTCCADRYEAPFFRIYSSMALKDNLRSGESYFIVEIKSLKRILDASVSYTEPVLCFVDEVLRGTNTVERIAASTQILKTLSGRNLLCFAATHDIELTELLKEYFDNYHFSEEVSDGDIHFNYLLREGRATTRNAIRLLELMGFDSAIIDQAMQQAQYFVDSGHWESR